MSMRDGSAGSENRQLTVEDLAAAWIAVHWADDCVDYLKRRDTRRIRLQAKIRAEGLGISFRKVTAAAQQSRCPAAAPEIPAIAGGLRRFGDVFLAYSTLESWEGTSRHYLPRIREAERALTALYLDWLTEILRSLFPDSIGRSVAATDLLAQTGGGSLALDVVKQCRVRAGDTGSESEGNSR